jgi:DHA1 family multidrug resistance protein-like MFS transporter
LIAAFGYRDCFVVSGVVVLLAGIAVQLFVREDFERTSEAEGEGGGGFFADALRLLRMGPFRLILVAMTLIQFTFGLIMPVIPLFLQFLADTDDIEGLAGPIFGAWMLVGGISSVVMGRWSDSLGARRTLQAGLLGAAVFYLAEGFAPTVTVLATLLILGGLASGAIRPVANTLIARIVPEEDRGKAFGVVTSATALGWALGPMAGGYLAAVLGFTSVFVLTASLFAALAVWVGFSLRGLEETHTDEQRAARVRAWLRAAFRRRRKP